MSIDSKITVSGWVGTQPRHVVTQNGTSFTVFRLGSTKRYFDRSQEGWVDGATTWFTVKTWRTAAVNVAESLRRSDPVVVHGALSTEVWDSPDGPRTTLVIEADALGPDLTRGQATFRHTVHHTGAESSGSAGEAVAGAAGGGGPDDEVSGGATPGEGGAAGRLAGGISARGRGDVRTRLGADETGDAQVHALEPAGEGDPWQVAESSAAVGGPVSAPAETVQPMSA